MRRLRSRSWLSPAAPAAIGVATLVLFCVGAAAPSPSVAVLYVDVDATGGANNGASWADAYTHLQDALTAAAAGGYEIWVAQGIYTPGDGTDLHATFQLKNRVGLYGGFAGGETSRDQRNREENETILSGDLTGNDGSEGWYADIVAPNCYHVVTGSGTNSTAVIDGFTVSGGWAHGGAPDNRGGGMCNDGGDPTVRNCSFLGNLADDGGGGMDNKGSDPTVIGCYFLKNGAMWGGGMRNHSDSAPRVTDCTFYANTTEGTVYSGTTGGGMHNEDSGPTVENCAFIDNGAWSGGGMANYRSSPEIVDCTFAGNRVWYGDGAGMYNYKSSPTVTHCTFTGNSADTFSGGGMCNLDSSPVVRQCTFDRNSAGVAGGGGGMFSSGGTLMMTDCMFTDNWAALWGGAMWNAGTHSEVTRCTFSSNEAWLGGAMFNSMSSPTVAACTFTDNRALVNDNSPTSAAGGGMFNESSTPMVIDCAFYGNSTDYYGGGMANLDSSPTLINSTFSGNEADDHGGGMYNDNSSPTVTNCTFFGNSKDGIYSNTSSPTVKNTIVSGNTPGDCNGSVTSGGYNLESGTGCGCTDATDLQNADPLLGPLADNGGPTLTHALLPGSPAIDAIPAPYNGAPDTDQRGVSRPQGTRCDIGAFERELGGDINGDGGWDLLDVVLCRQIASGLVHGTAYQRLMADVDDDGDVDEDDVLILSEYVLGIRTTLP